MNRCDLVVSLLFLSLGAALLAGAAGLPPGLGALPGPGFFPGVTGAVIALLAAGLFLSSLRGGDSRFVIQSRRHLALTAGLLLSYLLVWDVTPFAIRTFIMLVVFLRLLGERWRASLLVSAVLTAAVVLAFQYGLRVSFG